MRKTCVFFSQPTSKQFSVSLYTVFWWFPNYNYLLNNVAVCTVIYYNFMLYCTLMYIVWKLFFTLKKNCKNYVVEANFIVKVLPRYHCLRNTDQQTFSVCCDLWSFYFLLAAESWESNRRWDCLFQTMLWLWVSDNNEMIIHIGFKLTKHCLKLYV